MSNRRFLCSSFRFQHFHHLVGCGVGCTLLEEAGNGKDGVAHADFRHTVRAAVCFGSACLFGFCHRLFLLPLFQKIATNFFIKSCWIVLTCYCHFFEKSITSFFHKRRQAGILPLTPYKPQKSRMDGLSGKNFSGGSVFPDNKAFWKLCFARCMKKWQPFLLHCLIRNILKFAKMGAKKAANLFQIYCFVCRCGAAGYSVFMLSVKPELEQAFNQLCSDVVLHIRVVIAVHLREVADISSVSVKDGLYRFPCSPRTTWRSSRRTAGMSRTSDHGPGTAWRTGSRGL